MRLIQISAWNDSGGGFTHRLFDGHPQLRVWPFELLLGRDDFAVDLFDERWFRGRFRWPRLERELSAGRFDDLFDAISDAELKTLLRDPKSSKHADFALDVSISAWRSAAADRWALCPQHTQVAFLESYIEGFFDVSGDAAQGSLPVLGHCPVAILDASDMWADFPDARIVHVVRSPLGGFVDMRRRHPDLEATSYARKWALVNGTAALWAAKRPKSVTLVSLKQLSSDRESTMRWLTERLDLPFDAVLLAPTWGGRPLDPSQMGPFGGVPNIAEVANDFDPPELSLADREAIREITCGTFELLSALGLAIA